VNFAGALTWAFTFEDQPYFAGFRQLASCGLPLAVFNVLRMYSQMDGQRITAESDAAVPLDDIMRRGVREKPDVAALASRDGNKLCVMIWHYHDDDVKGDTAAVEVAVAGLPGGVSEAKLTHYRVDENNSNPYDAWRRMGSPIAPNQRQYTQLQEASNLGKLADAPATMRVEQGKATLKFTLPRQGVSLVVLEW
jgi:xylan 1,4-beta-xylosidase